MQVPRNLLGAQIQLRNNRRVQAAMRSSRLPAVTTLQEFDFTIQPSIKREQFKSLHDLGFLERLANVILLGLPGVRTSLCLSPPGVRTSFPPGVGKRHLAISLTIAAAQSGGRVSYGTLVDLIAIWRRRRQLVICCSD